MNTFNVNSKVVVAQVEYEPTETEVYEIARKAGVYGHVVDYTSKKSGSSYQVIFVLDKPIDTSKAAAFDSNLEVGSQYINPQSGSMTQIKNVVDSSDGKRVVEVANPTNPSESQFIEEETFKNTYQPVQTEGV